MIRLDKKATIILVVTVVILASIYPLMRFGFGYDLLGRTGWSATEDGAICYLDRSGKIVTGFHTVDGIQYYFLEDGSLASGFQTIGNDRYCFGNDGKPQTGVFTQDQNTYFADQSGKLLTGWQTLDEQRYYMDPATGAVCHGFTSIEGKTYYFDADGVLQTGWLKQEQDLYYLHHDGTMAVGWTDLDQHRFYFNNHGALYRGWLVTDDGTYYLKENGVMAIGQVTIDGSNCFFSSTGKQVLLVNNDNPLPDTFQPDLLAFGEFEVNALCEPALKEMMAAADADGCTAYVNNIYRSKSYQQAVWNRNIQGFIRDGNSYDGALLMTSKYVAKPGCSEHQTGLAVDFNRGMGRSIAWLGEHCWEYGFILRYPEGTSHLTGITHEPWHFRYVGTELSLELRDLGICLEEYMQQLTQEESEKTPPVLPA